MAIEYGHKVKESKSDKVLSKLTGLHAGEEVRFFGRCNNMRPMADALVITNARVLALSGSNISFDVLHRDIQSVTTLDKGTVTVKGVGAKEMTFKMVPVDDLAQIRSLVDQGRQSPLPVAVADSVELTHKATLREKQVQAAEWPNSQKVGAKLTAKASAAIERLRHGGEEPWLILASGGGAGVIAAFEDRLAVIKTGALTSFMAGSLGGERVATIYYRDITGIEYNAGFASGVLEILTPSYSGTSNKDFWRGSASSRNANSDDPWTLSNTLPLGKAEYRAAEKEINELRARVSKAKNVVVHIAAAPAPVAGGSIADELAKLSELFDAGVLSSDEFSAAKSKLLAT